MRFLKSSGVLLSLMLSVFGYGALAAVDPVRFYDQPELENRYEQLTHVLRCPKCQNQSIGGSDAPIANDMRRKVEEQLREGMSDKEIKDFMIKRYGDYVTYDPPLKPRTFILWFGPLIFFILVVLSFWLVFFRRPTKESM